jgi:hypothetical protein
MLPNIPASQGAEDGVTDGMDQDIGIGMPLKALLKGNILSAQDEPAARYQPVDVIS